MEKKMLSAKNDLIFKRVFGSQGSQDVLIGFLKSILDIPHDEYESITLLDTNLRINREKGKYGILDLKLKTTKGKIIGIEMQMYPMNGLIQRELFFISKMYDEQIEKSGKYEIIKRVVKIIILDYEMFPDREKYKHKFMLHDKEDDTNLTDLLEIYTLELNKLPQKPDNSKLYYWMKYFNATDKEEFEMLKTKDPDIKKAVMVLEELSEDDEMRILAEIHAKARMDEYDRIKTAESIGLQKGRVEGLQEGRVEGLQKGRVEGLQKGRVEGIQEGRIEGKLETATNLIKIGMPIEQIIEVTKLTIKQIDELKEKLN